MVLKLATRLAALRRPGGDESLWRSLTELEAEGFRTIQAIQTAFGVVDYVVAGPTGLFAVQAKGWEGRFRPRDGKLLSGKLDADPLVVQVRKAAAEIEHLVVRAGVETWAEAVIVATRARVHQRRFEVRHVTVLQADGLQEFFRHRTPRLTYQDVIRAASAVIRGDAVDTVRALDPDEPF